VVSDLLNVDPPEHTRLRRLVAGMFSTGRVEALRPVIARIAGELLDAVADRAELDVLAQYAAPLPTLVLAHLVGIPTEDCPRVQQWSDTFVSELLAVSDSLLSATTSLAEYTRELISRKRRRPKDDLISRLIAQSESERLSDEDLCSIVFVLLIAGQTATAQLIARGVYLLLANLESLAQVRAKPETLPAAVDEFLRHDPPLSVSAFRMASETLDIAGTTIPAGDIVLCSLASANNDAARFADPERLDVSRQDNPHLAFGHGIHRCLGASLAKVEAEIAIGSLLDRYPDPRLAVPPDELPWLELGIMRKLTGLPVRLT
jgi:cytochrome P450